MVKSVLGLLKLELFMTGQVQKGFVICVKDYFHLLTKKQVTFSGVNGLLVNLFSNVF